MRSERSGRGKPINRQAWPASGGLRDWLAFCDQVHRANGLPSLRALAPAMGLTSATRVGELLRGLALPADEKQARDLLGALGAVGPGSAWGGPPGARRASTRRHPPVNQLIANAPEDAMHPHASWLPGRPAARRARSAADTKAQGRF